jgi:hypothetical protein
MNRPFNEEDRRPRRARPQRYENDDYSRIAGPDYHENEYSRDYGGNYSTSRFDFRESGTASRPGVSGKSRNSGQWVNREEYNEQRNFIGKGPKGYKRSDDRIYEEVCETLMRSYEVNASEIGVKVDNGIVTLEGKVSSRDEKRAAEMEVEDLPGVLDIRNELKIDRNARDSGAAQAVKNDLGL